MTEMIPQTNQEVSPILSELDPMSLEKLMKADPLSLTKDHLAFIVQELRKSRVAWSEVEKVKKDPATKDAKAAKKVAATNLLTQLGLNLPTK